AAAGGRRAGEDVALGHRLAAPVDVPGRAAAGPADVRDHLRRLVTAEAVIRDAQPARPDDPIRIDARRSHLTLAVRNAAAGLVAPFFTTQGALWAGVDVVVVSRWRQGPQAMRDLHSGLISYFMMGLPVIYF